MVRLNKGVKSLKMKLFKSTEKAILNYANKLGYWPSTSQWDKYAKENNHMTFVGIYYHTRKSWETYRVEFGFPVRDKIYTREECVQAICQAAESLGQFFTRREYEEWQKDNLDLPTAAQISRRCNGWNNAKKEADLLPNAVMGKQFDNETIFNALRECAKVYGDLYSEEQYMNWRDGNLEIPHIETIRKRLDSLPEAKRKMNLQSYDEGAQYKYTEGRWKEPFLDFLTHALNNERYQKWAKENNAPSMKALFDNVGGYEKALLETLPMYMEKIKAGRKKR